MECPDCFYSLINPQNTLSSSHCFHLEAKNHCDSPGDSKTKPGLTSEKKQGWGYCSSHGGSAQPGCYALTTSPRQTKVEKRLQGVLSCDDWVKKKKTWGTVLAMDKDPHTVKQTRSDRYSLNRPFMFYYTRLEDRPLSLLSHFVSFLGSFI